MKTQFSSYVGGWQILLLWFLMIIQEKYFIIPSLRNGFWYKSTKTQDKDNAALFSSRSELPPLPQVEHLHSLTTVKIGSQ